jgi:uncharacterized protein (DUF302 family)
LKNENGLISVQSRFAVNVTIDRLALRAQQAGLLIFARIDHAQGAADIGLELRPTELLILGHPRGGTPLMLERQSAGIDLPIKALAWEDPAGRVWLTYNSGAWLSERHALGEAAADAVAAIDEGMRRLVSGATSEDG